MKNQKRIFILLISAGLFLAGFGLTRYVFFDLHGMKQWPLTLLLIGVIVTGISWVFKARLIPIMTAAAYSVSFLIGALLQNDSVDAGGTRTNNLWIIWTGVFLVLTIAGIVLNWQPNPQIHVKHNNRQRWYDAFQIIAVLSTEVFCRSIYT